MAPLIQQKKKLSDVELEFKRIFLLQSLSFLFQIVFHWKPALTVINGITIGKGSACDPPQKDKKWKQIY